MNECIDRNNAIERIEDEVIRIAKMLPDSSETRNLIKGAKDSIDTLKRMPSADVVERKHGHWIKDRFCSECGYDYIKETGRKSKYCPDCGAEMDEEVDNGQSD